MTRHTSAYVEVQQQGHWQFCGVINLPSTFNVFTMLARINNQPQLQPVAATRQRPSDISPEVGACLIPRSFITWYTLAELLSFDWNRDSGDLQDELEALRPLSPDPSDVRVNVVCTPDHVDA